MRIWSLALGALLIFVIQSANAESVVIQDFAWMDENHLTQQIEKIDDLGRQHYGVRVRGDKSDLELLQRLIDDDHIPPSDVLTLQALGAVLGNVLKTEVPQLQWKVYADNLGRSRALCLNDSKNCLFPVTMLSRRIEQGLQPNVSAIYDRALADVKPLLPRLPYTAD
ncbi:DUF3806 domain-containing protein [Marinimicrobium alkaliphilum]|uniref:DUF3806 domain-containing protein n=1 Tax=Marinimicrobium alkaliphilum TaxID=2202654 RepID=UPI000DB9400D|nr:DUF3806 domain-containing protein [Marinimicrobium alkaliphilum]